MIDRLLHEEKSNNPARKIKGEIRSREPESMRGKFSKIERLFELILMAEKQGFAKDRNIIRSYLSPIWYNEIYF